VTAAPAVVARAATHDRMAQWCGWVMVGAAALVPWLGWLPPLGFAPLLALVGLLCLPAVRIAQEDRSVLILLLGLLVWAAISTIWSPFRPERFDQSVLLQLALALPLYWSAVCGAKRADPWLNALALRVLALGLATFAVVLMLEAATGVDVYRHLHEAYYGAIRLDPAQADTDPSVYVLALLWPAALVGGARQRWELGLLAVAVAGVLVGAQVFGADAPLLAMPLASATMLLVWLWPSRGPRLLAIKAGYLTLFMPALIWLWREFGHYGQMERRVPESWGIQMNIWSRAIDWIFQRPLQGWGLDASRALGAGIALHPHNAALQIWLELGIPGAMAAASFWDHSLKRLARATPDLEMAGVAGSAAAFLIFAWVDYGLWQPGWLALGAYLAVVAAMLSRREESPPSTLAPISE
jgi:O-antigen ligase